MNSPALSALTQFANQKPGLQFANYGCRRTYAREARSIRADLARFNRALSDAMESGATDADLFACMDKGGRLQIDPPANRTAPFSNARLQLQLQPETDPDAWRVSYTTGQYFPTEYRKAAASVLERANAHARRRTAPTYAEPATTVAEVKRRNRRAGLHYFEDDRSTYTLAFPGCLIENLGPDRYRPVFQKLDGSIAFNFKQEFSTAAEARAHAVALRDANQIPKE